MLDYEKVRQKTIEENQLKMAELGIKKLAYMRSQANKSSKKSNTSMNSKRKSKNAIDEYTPTENAEINSSEDENEILLADKVKLRTSSKKVSNTSAVTMKDLRKILNSNNKKGHLLKEPQEKVVLHSNEQQDATSQVKLIKSNPKRKLASQSQEQEAVSPPKEQKRKVSIAPGSMSAYLKIKEKLRQEKLRGKQSEDLVQKLSFQNMELKRKKSQQEDFSDLEPERDEDAEPDGVHFGNDNQLEVQIDPLIEQDPEVADTSNQKKKTRGPTVCKDVLEWTDRKLIILNERGEPVGPDKKTVKKFAQFIGSISRNSTLAPLNNLSWHRVVDKDSIWNYIKTKFIIAEEGKRYVLSRVGCLWRRYKCSVKANHFSAFDNDIDRLNNAPNTIPKQHFMDLIEYWNDDEVQEESKKKIESSVMQMDRHTTGNMSFARKQYEMQQQDPEKKPPSQASLYKETRKRKAGNKYKTPFESIQSNIDKMEEVQLKMQVDGDSAYREIMTFENSKKRMQLQKCSRINGISKRVSAGGVILPDEYLKPLKDQIVKDTVAELMKTFEKRLQPDIFADINEALGGLESIPELDHDPQRDNANNSSGHINDQDHVEADEDEDGSGGCN